MKKYFLFSALVTFALYMLASFVKWDVSWIADLDKWDSLTRLLFLFFFGVKELFCIMIWDTTDIKKYFEFIK